MKKLILLLLLFTAAGWEAIAQQTISATINGGSEATVDCQGTATVNISTSGMYLVSTTGGAVIIDPFTSEEVPLLRVSSIMPFVVKAAYGGGTINIANQNNSTLRTSVELKVTDLETLVGTISPVSGDGCMPSDGTMQLTVPVDPRAGNVTYRWSVVKGKGSTTITSGQGTNTVTIASSSPETATVRVRISNDCSAEVCTSPLRDFRVRKTFSAADKQDLQIEGITCVTNPEDDVVVVAVPPVLGRYDETEYQWNLPASVQEEFRSLDGSAIAFSILDPSDDIIISLDLGPTCNPGYTLYKTVQSAPLSAEVGIASEGYVASNTFCLSDDNTTTETFRILNGAPGYTYDWIIPSNWQLINTSADGTEVNVRLANNSSGNITITSTNAGCGSAVTTLNINRYPTTAPNILGSNCVAYDDNNVLTYNVQGGDNTYLWEVIPASAGWVLDPNQTSVTGPSIDIIPAYGNIPASGNVTIRATIDGNCGSGAVTSELVVAIGPEAPAAITGPDCISDPGQNVTFSVDPVDRADSYVWSLPSGWSIVSGTGTNQVVVDPSENLGTVTVKAKNCVESGETSLAVNVGPNQPGDISYYVGGDPTNGCAVKGAPQSVTFSIPATVSGASNYTWSFPTAWGQSDITTADANTLSVTVTTDNSTGGTVSVVANNASGCAGQARTYDFIRSGLDYCIAIETAEPFPGFIVYNLNVQNLSGVALNYVWFDGNGTEVADGEDKSNYSTANPGTYTVSVKDKAECFTSKSYTIGGDNSGVACSGSTSSRMASQSFIDESLNEKVVLSPNPVGNEMMRINVPSEWNNVTVQIYNSNGQAVKTVKSFEKTDGRIEIPGRSKGTYFAIINSSAGPVYKKFVVK
ncbi:MAG: T9SS type A sorting domain-containing protein [Cyclobacteriaceae bacterium]